MSESQSRYSIVERLTKTKLDIMTAKSELKEQVINQKQKINDLDKDLSNWLQDSKEDKKREERTRNRQIETAKRNLKNLKERLEEKHKVYDTKLKALEDALNSIEEISKSTPTVNK